MPLITAFRPRPRQQDRYVVEVDGEPFATVTLEVIERLGLHQREPLLEGVGAQLLEESEALATYDRALRMLASRGRSAKDLEKRLVQKGEKREFAARAVEKLRSLGLVDDASFARARARVKLSSGRGRRRVELELQQQGVTREIARDAVSQAVEDSNIDSQAQANSVAQKKMRSLAKLDRAVQKRRLYAFLARRGFTPDEIRRAVDAAMRGET